jgi:hypothetical protein
LTHGDDSQKPWEEAAEWQRESAIKGVHFALEDPAFALASPDQQEEHAARQHEKWMADKLADGWTHGLVKDADKKTHPSLVPYDQLPPHEQAKDHLFQSIVRALAPFVTDSYMVA